MGQLAKTFGERVKSRRTYLRLSQAQLAEAAQVSEEWVRRIERGDGSPSFDTIEALARALDVSAADLFAERTPDDAAIEALITAARRMKPEELSWMEEASRLVSRRPG